MPQIHRIITIDVKGDTDEAVAEALDEALRLIKEGNIMGKDENETSSFFFENNPGENPRDKALNRHQG